MSLTQDKTKALWKGALVLTIAAIITKVLSAAYRIPFQNIAGDIGFYVYQQVYPFYSFVFILSLYGFPVAISKIVSDNKGKYDSLYIQYIVKQLFKKLLMLSILASFLLWIFAPFIARLMGDEQLTTLLQMISLSFWAVPFLSCYRGYFQGMEQMGPTAISQVIEQGIRVIGILLLSYTFIELGYGAYGAGLGATIGSVIGAFVGAIVLFLYYIKIKQKNNKNSYKIHKFVNQKLLRTVIINGFYFSLSSLVLVLFQFVDSLTLLRFLYVYGLGEETGKIVKGIYDRNQPLLQLGTMVTTAFSLTIVPLIARVLANKELNKARAYSELSIRLTLFIGLCATLGLAMIIEPVNAMLFMNRDGSFVLFILSFSIIFSALIVTTSAILQGYDEMKRAAFHVLVGLAVKVLVNILFIVQFGAVASAVGTVVGLAFNAILNLTFIYRNKMASAMASEQRKSLIMTVISMVIVTASWKYISEQYIFVSGSRSHEAILALSSVFIAVIVVFVLSIRFNVFTKDEVSQIPKLGRLYNKFSKR